MLTRIANMLASAPLLQLLVDAAFKGTLLLVLAVGAAFMLRRASADARHLLWAVTVSALVLLPLLCAVTPDWRVLPVAGRTTDFRTEVAAAAPTVTTAPVIGAQQMVEAVPATADGAAAIPTTLETDARATNAQLLLLAWLAGVLLSVSVVGLGFIRIHAFARRARRLTNGALLESIARISAELEVGAVRALEGSGTAMPMTWGVLHPKLLLPDSAHTWPRAKLEAVIRHELAHVRRHDPFWQLIAEFACAVYWFNPLVWYAARRMRIEREHACDDVVLSAGTRASEYASELLEIARSLRSARATSLAAIALAQPRQFEGRLLAVLDVARRRERVRRRWPAWLAAIVIVLPIAAASPHLADANAAVPILGAEDSPLPMTWQIERTPGPKAPRSRPIVMSGVSKQQANVRASSPLAQLQDPCARSGERNVSISSSSNDDTRRVKWEAGGCKGTLHVRGKVRLRGDLSGIESMPPGSDFRLWLNDGRAVRVVTARPNGDGIVHEYTVDGDKRPWNGEGSAWFASALTYVVRHTGFAADERIDYLLKQQGVRGVLTEVEAMSSDYVQRLYLQKLLARTTLNAGALATVIATATRTLESDYEMAELLIAIAKRYEFDDAVRRAFVDATRTLQSDYEHRRAVSAILRKGGLSSADVSALLVSSQAIKSDYEKAELLIAVADRYKLDSRMRTIYLASASNLKSDYERGRVYRKLLGQGELSAADAAPLLESVATMSSDHERAEILRLVPVSALSDERSQHAYLTATRAMRSDYELRRALTPLVNAERLESSALDLVLNAALRINSDYERAELLLAVVRRHPLTPAQRNLVMKAADALRSEYERGRVASALLRRNSN